MGTILKRNVNQIFGHNLLKIFCKISLTSKSIALCIKYQDARLYRNSFKYEWVNPSNAEARPKHKDAKMIFDNHLKPAMLVFIR